jgi:DNA replication initiation complex subunit (GINS family)
MLTFESIRDVERTEREVKKVQKLPPSFLAELKEYLERKEQLKEKSSADIMEIENVKSTVQRIIELRERKMVEQALITARTNMPPENLLKEEEQVFWQIVEGLKAFRRDFFEQLRKPKEVLFRVRRGMPEFVGPDMKTYLLKENDVVALPKEVAELLIREGTIEEAK